MAKEFDLNQTKNFLKKLLKISTLPKILAERPFLTFLIFSFFAFFLGGFVFYKYSYLAEKKEPKIKEKPLEIEIKSYQEILNFWNLRSKKIEESALKRYINPFQEIREKEVESSISPSELKMPETLPKEKIKELKKATTLYEFYKIKGGNLPTISERARMWQEKGLGKAEDYQGFYNQNINLLAALKKELTE